MQLPSTHTFLGFEILSLHLTNWLHIAQNNVLLMLCLKFSQFLSIVFLFQITSIRECNPTFCYE